MRARRLREIGGRVINFFTHAVLLGAYRDTQCGLKAFRSDVARAIFERSRIDGFAFDVEVFVIAERNGFSVAEVPVARRRTAAARRCKVVRDAIAPGAPTSSGSAAGPAKAATRSWAMQGRRPARLVSPRHG